MRAQYLSFTMDANLTIKQAMEMLYHHMDPLHPELSDIGFSYGEMLLYFAESLRAKGHPDWMQILAVLQGLGR